MAIPNTIYQTYKTSKLPFIFRLHIRKLKKKNPNYDYQFYEDKRINNFIQTEYGDEIFSLYKRINIGAAKADFFRYAILYKKGGIYLDIDSLIVEKIDNFIKPNDVAVISYESNNEYFLQYALFFEANHPFLKKTMELVLSNVKENKYPYDTHKMTGPTVYTKAIKECIKSTPNLSYRILGIDYKDNVKFSFRGSKTFLYGILKRNHWKKISNTTPVININN